MSELDRYIRQTLFAPLGEAGQLKLLSSSVLLVGCGALGSHVADRLVRAGVGRLVIVDRDYIELSNLQRQALFDEDDIEAGLPKSIAAAEKLRRINSQVEIEPRVADVNYTNIEELLEGIQLVMDGSDNFETRYLINDACVKHHLPWIYGGSIANYGMTMTIRPYQTACLRCLFPEAPPPGSAPTCDTVGVLNAVPATIAAIQSSEAIKLLAGVSQLNPGLIHIDLWENTFETLKVARRVDTCPACGSASGGFEYLEGREGAQATLLCGRDAVQIRVLPARPLSLPRLAQRLQFAGDVSFNEFLLRLRVDSYEITVFPDARAIVKGTDDEALAKSLYSKFIGD
ncbi:MAG: ThiF family adenylyltransferase [Chloroflexi bacterium]|nr:ThiF family adenylyltransferase [Chloroflexota bacterium]